MRSLPWNKLAAINRGGHATSPPAAAQPRRGPPHREVRFAHRVRGRSRDAAAQPRRGHCLAAIDPRGYTLLQVTKKRLKVVEARSEKLGRLNIMDRALAHRYGTSYVYLAAFAIDIDRVHELDPEDGSLPFGWEVWLVERYLVKLFGEATEDPVQMVEHACLSVMDLPHVKPGQQAPFGSQLPFAIYSGVARKLLPNRLGDAFHVWKKPPLDLLDDLRIIDEKVELGPKLVQHCLQAKVQPALIPPVVEALGTLLASR
jgi:hypothetical protein